MRIIFFIILALSVTACENEEPINSIPLVSTELFNADYYEVQLSFSATYMGEAISEHGLIFDINPQLTIANEFKIRKTYCTSLCNFKYTITGLTPSTRYYYRAYAVTKKGIYYSDEFTFTTLGNEWTKVANFPGPKRVLGIAFAIGNRAYAGLGLGEFGQYYNDFWEYNPENNTWTRKADFPPGGRADAVGFSVGNKGYAGTGFGHNETNSDFWEYDPATDKWTQKAEYPGGKLEYAIGFAIGENGYLGVGHRRSPWVGQVAEFYRYTPVKDSWEKLPDFPGVPVDKAVAGVSNGKGYMGLGSNSSVYSKEWWEFDPTSQTWTRLLDYPENGRMYSTCISIEGNLIVSGGKSLHQFIPEKKIWQRLPDFPGESSIGLINFTLNNQSYCLFGSTNEVWMLRLTR